MPAFRRFSAGSRHHRKYSPSKLPPMRSDRQLFGGSVPRHSSSLLRDPRRGAASKDRPTAKDEFATQASAALPLTAMRLVFDFAFDDLGKLTVSTPFLNEASTLASSTS